MDDEDARNFAGFCVCRAIAERDDETLVNTNGFTDFPAEVKAWDKSVGPHTFYPMNVLAAYAAQRPIPEPPSEPPC